METIHHEGPFDGVVGFSQGGALAGMVASLLEEGRKESMEALTSKDSRKFPFPSSFLTPHGELVQAPMKFAIIYSGFVAPMELYSGFYEPKIKSSTLIVVGSLDTVVEEKRTTMLIDCIEGGKDSVITHPGGHFVPSGRQWLDASITFIKGCVGEESARSVKELKEEKVEDMNV